MTDHDEALRHFKTVLWPQAYRTGDVELLDSMLDDTFQMIDADGNRSTKADELEYLRTETWDPGEFEYRIERLSVYDGVAIIDGQGIASEYIYRSSNVLIRRGDRWQAIASHVSGVTARSG